MTNRKQSGFIVLVFAAGLTGCDGTNPSTPTGPSTVPPQPIVRPAPSAPAMLDVTISGMVFELTPSGRAPIEGVILHCGACGAETHAWAYTDSEGVYEFVGVWPDGCPQPSLVEKARVWRPSGLPTRGLPQPSRPGSRTVTIDGDTRLRH